MRKAVATTIPRAEREAKNMGFQLRDSSTAKACIVVLLSSLFFPKLIASQNTSEADLLEFPLNVEYLKAELFLFGAAGHGLDAFAPKLADGGPSPIGARTADLGLLIKDIIFQFGLQEVGHLRAIKSTVKGFPRPLLNLSKEAFGEVMNSAFGRPLFPPFDPYANETNYLLASYVIIHLHYIPLLENSTFRSLVGGFSGVDVAQEAVIRGLLYERKALVVVPYGVSVAEFTNRISALRNKLGKAGLKDEGLVVPKDLGAEGRVTGNVLTGDNNSISYDRTPEEILRIAYGTGDEHLPGCFYPRGADGSLARSYLGNA